MTTTQILRFCENRDTSSISYKKYNQAPHAKYPTFSLCLQGTQIYSFHDTQLLTRLGLTSSSQYVAIMKGEIGSRYNYQYTTGLYDKVPLDIRNISNEDFFLDR